MTKLLNDKGYDVIWQEANHDVNSRTTRSTHGDAGVKALIIIAEDGDAQ